MRISIALSTTALLAAMTLAAPVYAQSLGNLVNLNGNGSDDATVEVDLRDGVRAEVNLGGANADVNVNTNNGVNADANVNLLGDNGVDVDADVNLLGNNGLANADVSIDIGGLLDTDIGIGIGNPGGPGAPGGPGTPGTPGFGVAGGGNGGAVACIGADGQIIVNLIRSTDFTAQSWARATGVQIVPLEACPAVMSELASVVQANGNAYAMLYQAIARDALISASLARSNYSVQDVIAVGSGGAQLSVYVY